MKWSLVFATLLFVAVCDLPTAGAQACASSFMVGHCIIEGGSCSKLVPQAIPSDYGYMVIMGTYSCCGEQVQAPVNFAWGCEIAMVDDKSALPQLAALAKTTDLLAVTCDGYIRHFRMIDVASDRRFDATRGDLRSTINANAF